MVLRVVGCSLAEVWLGTHRVASSSRAQSRLSQGLVGFSEHDNVQGATESGFFIIWRGVHQGFLISPISRSIVKVRSIGGSSSSSARTTEDESRITEGFLIKTSTSF